MNELEASRKGTIPSWKEGALRPIKKWHATLNRARQGRSERLLQREFDLPGRAESKVALHLLDRRGHPSFEEGIVPYRKFFRLIPHLL